jgi:transposase
MNKKAKRKSQVKVPVTAEKEAAVSQNMMDKSQQQIPTSPSEAAVAPEKIDPCGVEVSAQELVLALRRGGQRQALKSFPNTPEGHGAVVRYLARKGRRVQACMESTGVYGLDLALLLAKQPGIQVMVANPRAVRHFAQAMMERNKSDRVDAVVLLEFAARLPFEPWRPPAQNALHLCALARRLEAITELGTAEKNRLHATQAAEALPRSVRQDIERSIRFHERAAERLTGEALKLIAADSKLQLRYTLLDSIPGIGETSAVQILAELVMISSDLDVRQWVAYAGLDPRQYSSGTSVRKKVRISKAGNAHLRRALYMPALVAVGHDPHLRAFYQHLQARGKLKMQALVAVMRKLLHAIFGMFKHQQVYDGTKVFRLPEGVAAAPSTPTQTEVAA